MHAHIGKSTYKNNDRLIKEGRSLVIGVYDYIFVKRKTAMGRCWIGTNGHSQLTNKTD